MAFNAPPFEIANRFQGPIQGFVGQVLRTAAFFPDITGTSWYRDASDNARVGGAPNSQHLLALAVDALVEDRRRFVSIARHFGLTAVDEGTHVHLQAFPAGVIPRRFFV